MDLKWGQICHNQRKLVTILPILHVYLDLVRKVRKLLTTPSPLVRKNQEWAPPYKDFLFIAQSLVSVRKNLVFSLSPRLLYCGFLYSLVCLLLQKISVNMKLPATK